MVSSKVVGRGRSVDAHVKVFHVTSAILPEARKMLDNIMHRRIRRKILLAVLSLPFCERPADADHVTIVGAFKRVQDGD